MSEPLIFPDEYVPLLSPSDHTRLESIKLEAKEHNSKLTSLPPLAGSIPQFFETKILLLEAKKRYLQTYSAAIRVLQRDGKISCHTMNEEIQKTSQAEVSAAEEASILKRGRKLIQEDMEDEIIQGIPLEDAYRDVMVDRIRVATSQQRAVHFNRPKFRKAVVNYYSANDSGGTWCHLMGWIGKGFSKASHLVPKSLDSRSCTHLFGDVNPATDVRNALLLHPVVEPLLDSGDIAIVPVVGEENEWRCIVTRPGKHHVIDSNTKVDDLHGRHLRFRSSARPAKRYLFFRFLMTFLRRELEGDVSWVKDVERSLQGWVTPGGYLRESTLVTLARYFCDEELTVGLSNICESLTFPDREAASLESDFEMRSEQTLLDLKKLFLPSSSPGGSEDHENDSGTDIEYSDLEYDD